MKSRYDKNNNTLREQPEMDEPKKEEFTFFVGGECFVDNELFGDAHKKYEKQKAACRVIPCSENNWKDGQELVLDVDYFFEEQFWEGSSWWPTKHLLGVVTGTKLRIVAIPIVAQETESQYDLWEDVQDIVHYEFEGRDLRKLKKLFTIQRRKQ